MSNKSLDFASLTHVSAEDLQVARAAGSNNDTYSISVVHTKGNGKRVKLSKALFDKLGKPKKLQFVPNGEHLIIGKVIPHCTESVPFSSGTGVNIIYTSGFVHYLTNHFNLDFSERTSIAFRDVEICEQEFEGKDIIFAKIKMVNTSE